MEHTGTNSMTKDKLIETLKMAQDALYMATLPFPIDEIKTRRALEAVEKALDVMPLFDDWDDFK
jgi:hypothetical protein